MGAPLDHGTFSTDACFFVKNSNTEDQVEDIEFYISTGVLIPGTVTVEVAREPTKNTSAFTIANRFTARPLEGPFALISHIVELISVDTISYHRGRECQSILNRFS